MGYASTYAPCGCSIIRLMESGNIIVYVRCIEHYTPEDDVKILEADKNRREHEKQIWEGVNKVWSRQ